MYAVLVHPSVGKPYFLKGVFPTREAAEAKRTDEMELDADSVFDHCGYQVVRLEAVDPTPLRLAPR